MILNMMSRACLYLNFGSNAGATYFVRFPRSAHAALSCEQTSNTTGSEQVGRAAAGANCAALPRCIADDLVVQVELLVSSHQLVPKASSNVSSTADLAARACGATMDASQQQASLQGEVQAVSSSSTSASSSCMVAAKPPP